MKVLNLECSANILPSILSSKFYSDLFIMYKVNRTHAYTGYHNDRKVFKY